MEALGDLAGRLRDVTVRFGGRTVLDRVALDIPAGRTTVLLGSSGSGKTTLLRTLNRLNEEFPGHERAGRIQLRIDDRDLDIGDPGLDLAYLRRRVAMVFQSPNVLPMSVDRNVRLPLELTLGITGSEADARIEKALSDARVFDDVKDRLHEPASTLSGGQQQRLCLARALALEPTILLLDEPTASLDFRAARKIESLIDSLRERYTILAVSHSIGQAARIADKAAILRDGRVVETLDRDALADPDAFHRLAEELF